MLIRATAGAVALAAVAATGSCSPSRAGDRTPSPPGAGSAAGSRASLPDAAPLGDGGTPSYPADATFADGAIVTIQVPARRPGNLFVDVVSERTPNGTTTRLRVIRDEDCHLDKAQPGAPLYVCTTTYDRRKTLPAGAFTFDGLLGTAKLRTTVDGKPLTVTWTGHGTSRRQVNENGHLLVEARDAVAVATWGKVRHTDDPESDVKSSVYRRVTAR